MFCICDTLAEEEAASTIKRPILSPGTPVDDDVRELEKEVPTEPFLGEQREEDKGKKTLVLDLDETLIHSSFDPNQPHKFSIPVFVGGKECRAFVAVRPGVELFLENMNKLYEVVVYTASSQNVRAGAGDDV